MHSKFVQLGSLSIIGMLAATGGAAHADQINTSALICQPSDGRLALDFDYSPNQVGTAKPGPHDIVCAIPRSSLVTGTTHRFFVDGQNSPNSSTRCTLFMYAFGGPITQSLSFTESATTTTRFWDHLVDLPLTGTSSFDYAALFCTLPGSGLGSLFGVTAVQ